MAKINKFDPATGKDFLNICVITEQKELESMCYTISLYYNLLGQMQAQQCSYEVKNFEGTDLKTVYRDTEIWVRENIPQLKNFKMEERIDHITN